MKLKKGESYEGFELLEEKAISEIEGSGKWLYHKKSGVTLLALQNKDRHKVFSVNFATLPEDNKGTAHIVEHAVCCASKKYPLKETFMAVSQGSICTTMNACTYPDRTMYYVASAHEKDLMGIAQVFLDMVFHPSIEESSQYFLQEGWHYQYDEESNVLDASGVVYHEMLGEYGEAGSYLQRYELETLFPDTCYQYDSGGIPEEIIQLKEEEFLAFYQKYYVGENAVITLYGDFNLEETLKLFNRVCLQEVKKGEKCLPPSVQQSFKSPRYTLGYYPTTLNNGSTLMSLSFVIGQSMDCEMRLAFEILEQILLRSTASPLLKRLVMEEQLGMSLSEGGYDSCRMQPVFSITLKGSEEKKATLFEAEVLAVLESLVTHGLDVDLINAAIESLEFELKETDASYEPIGMIYSEMMLSSYLYGGNPFNHLCYKEALERIKAQCHKGYFEDLINRYLLNNLHRSLTVVVPSKTLQEEKETAQERYFEEIKNHIGVEGLEEIETMNEWLEEEQLKENEEVLLDTLPQLTLKDMPEKLESFKMKEVSKENCSILFHEEETKDIIYLHYLWDVSHMPPSSYQDMGLLAHVFSYIGTKKRGYDEIENTINTLSGGFHTALHAYTAHTDGKLLPTFKTSCKVLAHHLGAFMKLMKELFSETIFEEKEKLKELIGHIVYEMERSFTGAPEYRATQRIYTYLCEQGVYEDQVSGMAFYEYIKEIYTHYDREYEALKIRLMQVMQDIFNKNCLKIVVTAPIALENMVLDQLEALIKSLPVKEKPKSMQVPLDCYMGNEGFFNGQEGQAVAQGIDFKRKGLVYKGQYEVVANVLENTYLWDRIRLQGGAYGCDVMLSKEGYLVICSYCDPHLQTTLQTYGQIGHYLKNIKLSSKTIERAIISTLGGMIAPCSMEQKSERACTYFITGMKQEDRQLIYDQIKQTTLKDFHDMSKVFQHLAQEGVVCVLGNKEKLKVCKSQFKLIDLKI
ncbi:MAG: hypothetical protein E7231_03605 [Cellulosilyticum sp.]|nr:hypothetical protein [Cellulosilyticum sp.]